MLRNNLTSSEFSRTIAVLRSFLSCVNVKKQRVITACYQHITFILRNIFKCSTTFNLQNDFVVETSLVGTVMNGLSHLHGSTDRGQFIINLLRGLGGNLNMKSRQEFAKEVIAVV